MDTRDTWRALQAHLADARTRLEAGDRAGALKSVGAALAIDPSFLAAQALRQRIELAKLDNPDSPDNSEQGVAVPPLSITAEVADATPPQPPSGANRSLGTVFADVFDRKKREVRVETSEANPPVSREEAALYRRKPDTTVTPTAVRSVPPAARLKAFHPAVEADLHEVELDTFRGASASALGDGPIELGLQRGEALAFSRSDGGSLSIRFDRGGRARRRTHSSGGRWLAAAAVFAALTLGASRLRLPLWPPSAAWTPDLAGSSPLPPLPPLPSRAIAPRFSAPVYGAFPSFRPSGTARHIVEPETVATATPMMRVVHEPPVAVGESAPRPFPISPRRDDSPLPASAEREPEAGNQPLTAAAEAIAPPPAPAPTPASAPASSERPAVPATNHAQIDDERGVKQALQRYRTAYERLDAQSARTVWPSVDEAALARAFDSLQSQTLTFTVCDVRFRSQAAVATCQGSTRYTPKIGSREARIEPRVWTFTLRKRAGDWQIDSVRAER